MISLKCPDGKIKALNSNGERIIICYAGFNQCIKPENQGVFDTNCFMHLEIVRD